MKKTILIILAMVVASLSFSLNQTIDQTSLSSVNVKIEADYQSVNSSDLVKEEKEGILTHIFALLAEDIEIVINEIEVGVYDSKGNRYSGLSSHPHFDKGTLTSRVYLSDSFVLREMYGFTINTEMLVKQDGYLSVIEKLDFDVIGIGTKEMPTSISEAFYPTYKEIADNFRSSYMVNLPFKQPSMLIISHDNKTITQALEPFINWKRERGMEVNVIFKEDIDENPSADKVKASVRNFYNNAENKPDYLMLIGDVSGNFSLPTYFHFTSPYWNATDLPFSVMAGDGYIPDLLVGRISIQSAYHLHTIVSKTLLYEKNPMFGDWMDKALVVACNFATTLPIPITPILTSRWIADLLHKTDFDVTEIYWETGDGGYGTTQIIEALGKGVQFVSYRGWGDANGWHYPQFRKEHLRQIQNGPKMPIVTSWVCNTGDYANTTIDPCFGEEWMRMGTPVNPNGCVAFIGPSDLYTSTEYNNAMSTGFYWGIMREGIRTFSSALLRGKMELYKNYPTQRNPGQMMDHYFKVYNVLSDPSMKMWVLRPDKIALDIPETISSAASHIEFPTPGLEGGYVTITRDRENFQTFRIDGDYVFIPLTDENTEDIWITVAAENYVPVQKTIEVYPSEGIEMIAYDFDGKVIAPGVELPLNITLKNFGGSEVKDISATLTTTTVQYVDIIEDTDNFGNIAAGGTAQGSFTLTIHPDTPRFTPIQLELAISPTNNHAKIQTIVTGLLFTVDKIEIDSENRILDPGETADITVHITNHGEIDATNLIAYVLSGSNAVEVQEEALEFGNIPIGESGQASFTASAKADAFIGRLVYFQLDFEDEIGREARSYFNITLGKVNNTDPTGPCPYGYYAYDSNDVDYEYAPTYDWVNIDPEDGGPGTALWIGDDDVRTIGLPFKFRYYGMESDSLSICSNGWVSLIPTWMINFRNWSIPSAENPYGIIAAFWDDLKGLDEVEYKVRIAWYHDEANNRFIVSWLDAYNWANRAPSGLEQVQLILEPREGRDGDLVFQYHSVWNKNQDRNYSTQGIQSPCNRMGLQYAFHNVYPPSASKIEPGLAIRFTTDAPDPYTAAEDITVPSYQAKLMQNYPNPFNPETVIEFNLSETSHVSLEIYNIRGQKVRTLVSDILGEGNHKLRWDGKDDNNNETGTGVYFYKLETPRQTETKRMIMMK